MNIYDVMSAQFGRTGWRQKAPTKREALRQLLSDGQPHSNFELAQVAGHRFGARLFEAHGEKKALHYSRVADEFDDSKVIYRRTEKRLCTLCSKTKGESK